MREPKIDPLVAQFLSLYHAVRRFVDDRLRLRKHRHVLREKLRAANTHGSRWLSYGSVGHSFAYTLIIRSPIRAGETRPRNLLFQPPHIIQREVCRRVGVVAERKPQGVFDSLGYGPHADARQDFG